MVKKNKRQIKKRSKKEIAGKVAKELGLDKNKWNIKIVNLDNKTRKGKYIYIKERKGKARYYKHTEGISLDNYLNAFRGKLKVKKKGVVEYKGKKPAEIYVKKIRRQKTLDSLIGKGISEKTTVSDLLKVDRAGIRIAYKQMLKPLVKDEKLLDILALNENVEKYKYRIESRVSVISADGKILMEFMAHNKSIDNTITDFGKIKEKGDVYAQDLSVLKKKGWDSVRTEGTTITGDTNGNVLVVKKVGRIQLNLRYVKGR